ncbi:MAG: hypothetical protein AAGI63_09460, partial [Planctomycetota bacterium]
MGLRHVARTVGRSLATLSATGLVLTSLVLTEALASDGANVRIATFETAEGEGYFAASIQPSADDALMQAARTQPADVVVVVDTSASQSGAFRSDSIAALRTVIDSLRSQDRVRVYAADVRASDLSKAFVSADETDDAIAQLKRRLPLGHTKMLSVIDSVRSALVSSPQDRTRSIVYIGDAASIDAIGNEKQLGNLIDALRADRIAVHSVAIGPSMNIQLMAVLANQTGGMLGVFGTGQNDAKSIATRVAASAKMSPIWLKDAKLLSGMKSIQADRLPPLRLDRDSIFLGMSSEKDSVGKLEFAGETTASSIRIVAEAQLEPAHPDFAFLPGLIQDAQANNGLTLPTAGSPLLRETARLLAAQAEELVRASNMALQQGNKRGARAVAEQALKADPNNVEAQALERITGNLLVVLNPQEGGIDEVFGGGDDVFGGQPPAGDAPAQAGDDPFGTGGDDPFAEPAGEATTEAAPATAAGTQDPFGAGGSDNPFGGNGGATAEPAGPAPALGSAGAAAPIQPPMTNLGGGMPAGDDELMEEAGNMLNRARSNRAANEGRLRAEVRAALRVANRQLRTDPTGVAGSLKSLLSSVESTPDVNPQLRQELASEVRAAIQIASRREATYADAQRDLEQAAQAATTQQRLLEETFRREATLRTLSDQMNGLIAEGRYEDADGEVSIPFARLAGDTITRDSTSGRHFRDVPLMLQTYARDRRYQQLRERNFVDAFSLVLKAHIPFVDEPPIVYPDAEVWQRMSRRRLERYGAIELVGDNETERMIESALDNEMSANFVELPLGEAVRQIGEEHDIPIVVDNRALEEIGLSADEPVNLQLKNVSLRSFLRLMLRELDLTYMIKDEVMQITTIEAAEQNLINKVYPVGDLVVPIIQLGGGGGMGGMGGGMGGMGGGMGGMGGGMGGM